MKSLIISLLILVSPIFLFSQNPLVFDENRSSEISDIHFTAENSWIQARIISSGYDNGLIEWVENNEVVSKLELYRVRNLQIREYKGEIYIDITIRDDCDIWIPYFISLKLDELIQKIDNEELYFGEPLEVGFTNIGVVRDSIIFQLISEFSDDVAEGFQFMDMEYQIKYSVPDINLNSIRKIEETEDYIFAFGGEDIMVFNDVNTSFQTINLNGSEIIDIVSLAKNVIYVLTQKSVIKFDENLVATNEYFFSAEGITPKDLEWTMQGLTALVDESGKSVLYFLDEESSSLISLDYNIPANAEMQEIYIGSDGGIYLSGNIIDLENDFSQIRFATIMDMDAPYHAGLEYGLSDLFVDYTEINGELYYEIKFNITNHSDFIVNDLDYSTSVYFAIFCSTIQTEGVVPSLMPGESKEIQFTIHNSYIYNDVEICLYSYASDKGLDPNLSDNKICAQLVNTQDLLSPGMSIKIFPNPAREFLNLEGNKIIGGFSIYDFAGSKVKQGIMERQIDIQDLHSGIYILKLSDGSHYKFFKL